MTSTAAAPTTDVGSYKILIEGQVLNPEYQVVSIDIQQQFNRISSARILILDGDPAKQLFKISQNEAGLAPGKSIEVKLGYHQQDYAVFKGIILRHAIRSKKKKQSFLFIEARSAAVKLSIGRKNKSYYGKTDSNVLQEIADSYGLSLTIDKTTFVHQEMIQHAVTDWDFLVMRAEMNGMLVQTASGGIQCSRPAIALSAAKKFTFGIDDIYEVEAEVDARNHYESIISQSWNPKTQALEISDTGETTLPDSGTFASSNLAKAIGLKQLVLTHAGNLADEELKGWSDSFEMRSRLAKIRGRIKVQGQPDLNLGDTIELAGLSNKFNGKMLVCGIYQQFAVSNWETDIQFGMLAEYISAREDLMDRPASGLIPGIEGLQIGLVVKLENDPAGEDRVQVRIPFVSSDEGIWARVSCLDAGANRGSYFRPEIGDEVILAFINNDPRYPVILGMLNSSNKPAPLKAADVNNEKGFVTRSGFKFIFNDDQHSCQLISPKGKSLLIQDQGDTLKLEDDHSNKITLNSAGISLESRSDLHLKATGEISLEAATITQKASAQFSASGSGSLKMTSTGVAELTGSMVKIN